MLNLLVDTEEKKTEGEEVRRCLLTSRFFYPHFSFSACSLGHTSLLSSPTSNPYEETNYKSISQVTELKRSRKEDDTKGRISPPSAITFTVMPSSATSGPCIQFTPAIKNK
jgi:hypothetical protein